MRLLLIMLAAMLMTTIMTGQPINRYVDDVVQPAPNEASLGKYGDIPVSYYTGIPSTSIPIHVLQQGPLHHPVSLSYHAGGIKGEEMASRVGLGWTLLAGGSITRMVNGLRDEDPITNGYYTNGTDLDILSNTEQQQLINGLRDGEPDLFSFSCGGYSGKFYIDADQKAVLVPLQDIQIKINHTNNAFESFIIVTPEGNRHHFGKYGGSAAYDITSPTSGISYTTTWHLLRTETYDRLQAINFTYENDNYSYTSTASCRAYSTNCSIPGSSGSSVGTSCSTTTQYHFGLGRFPFNTTSVTGKRLASISSDTETITFTSNTVRTDLQTNLASPSATKRLDEIEVSTGSGGSALCKKYVLGYSYFTDATHLTDDNLLTVHAARRLKLDRVTESACNGSLVKPPYVLTYYSPNNVRWRHSKAIDHWGYPNNQVNNNNHLVNIPSTTISAGSSSATWGSSDRTAHEASMLPGTLQNIEYPTGGSSSFVYEAHKLSTDGFVQEERYRLYSCVTPGPSCCDNPKMVSETRSFMASELVNPTIKLCVSTISQPGLCGDNTATITLKVFKVAGNVQVITESFNIDQSTGIIIDECMPYNASVLQPNTDYRFELSVTDGRGYVSLCSDTVTPLEETIGGLRIKQITTHDGISTSRDIVRTYKYVDTLNKSSAVLYYRPQYGQYITGFTYPSTASPGPVVSAIWSTTSFVPMSSFENNHVAYERVIEDIEGGGRRIMEYHAIKPLSQSNFVYPYPPLDVNAENGMEQYQALFERSDTIHPIFSTQTAPEPNFAPSVSQGDMYRISEPLLCNISGTAGVVFLNFYNIRTEIYRVGQITTIIDSVETIAEHQYHSGSFDVLESPVVTSMTNSDNKKYHTLYTYPFQATGAAYDSLESLNVVTPVEVALKQNAVPTQGDTIDGTIVAYDFFPTMQGAFPYPSEYLRREVTWDGTNLIDSGNVSQAVVNAYDFNEGMPTSVTIDGWDNPLMYTYSSDGLRTSESYDDFRTGYLYHPDTRLLQRDTSINQTTRTYTYDQLFRLKTLKDDCRDVTTTLDYVYGAPASSNFVRTTQDFAQVPSSGLNLLVNRTYFDGLGRSIQVIQEDQGPTNTKDIVISTEYDSQGRILHTYEPSAIDNNNGAFRAYNALPDTNRTIYTYENSPLDRVDSTVHTGFPHATYTIYGHNDDVVIGGTEVGELFRQTIIDGDRKENTTYTDKRGRVVATEQAGPNRSAPITTRYTYDDKDRVTKIVPPASIPSSTSLNFDYKYYTNDLIKEKKVPDQDAIEYRYNDRDLLVSYQDGFLSNRATDPWINTRYDGYGRPIRTGFGTPLTNNTANDPAITDANRLSQTNYVTSGIHVDQIDRYTTWILRPDGVLNPADSLPAKFSYDPCGRAATAQAVTLLNNDILQGLGHTYTYDGADNVVLDEAYQRAYNITHNIDVTRTVDFAGRPHLLQHKFDNPTTVTLSETLYNQRNQTATHKVGLSGATYLQTCDYTYLENGWLSGINEMMSGNDLFSLQLHYDDITAGSQALPQHNGNIAEVISTVKGRDPFLQAFRYGIYNWLWSSNTYDISGTTLLNAQDYQTIYNQDQRGNLTWIFRQSNYPDGSGFANGVIDNLVITMQPGTNKIQTVEDTASTAINRWGVKGSMGHFVYDNDGTNMGNGNITYDPTIGATIVYNHLNLPRTVDFGNDRLIEFTYDADGNQLRKVVRQGTSVLEDRYYIDGLEYKDGALVQVMHDEGRIAREVPCDQNQFLGGVQDDNTTYFGDNIISNSSVIPTGTTTYKADQSVIMQEDFTVDNNKAFEAYIEPCSPGDWQYEYVLRDHLGNTRVVFTEDGDDPDILQEEYYYPYGMSLMGEWQKTPKQDFNYKYNSKELHRDYDFNWYSYGARFYNPSIGRFVSVDPLAEAYNFQSTYAYVANNPISNIDILGLAAMSTQELFDKVWEQGDGTYDNDGNRTGGSSNGGGWPDIGAIVSNAISSFWQSLGFSEEDAPTTSTTMSYAEDMEGRLENVADAQTAFMPGGGTLKSVATGEVDELGIAGDIAGIFGLGFLDDVGKQVIKNADKLDEFNQARNAALAWLQERGFKAEVQVLGKFGSNNGKTIGMKTSGKSPTGFRIEFDERNGAHINVFSGKEKGPHFRFGASAKTVEKLQRRFNR